VTLPEGVEKKTVKGRTYFYWNPGRGTAREGKRVRLPNLDASPAAFFKELELYTKPAKPVPLAGSVGFLVQRYRDSEDFKKLSDSTKASYSVHLNRFEIAWGALSYDLPAGAVIALRDSMADTAGMANHMLSVGRTLWKWGRAIGVQSNPFIGVANLDVGDVGHILASLGDRTRLQGCLARSRAHGTTRLGDLSARIRSHPHGAGAARSPRPMVPAEENQKEAQSVLHPIDACRCTNARSLATDENCVYRDALEGTDTAYQRGLLSVLPARRPLYRNELARALAPLAQDR